MTDPTDELTRLRAEVLANQRAMGVLRANLERMMKQRDELRAENERLMRERDEWRCSALLYHSELRDLAQGKKVETQLAFPVEQLISELRAQLATAERDYAVEDAKSAPITWAKFRAAWDRTIDRVPGLSRNVSLGALDELAEHLGLKKEDTETDEYCLILKTEFATLTAAAVVKDAVLKRLIALGNIAESWELAAIIGEAKAALSPTSSPLLADVQAAAVALKAQQDIEEDIEEAMREDDPKQQIEDVDEAIAKQPAARELRIAALARLARWITPEIAKP